MAVTRPGTLRAGSVVSTARARDTLKRRDKPYKIEKRLETIKKKRIQFEAGQETSYKKSAPRGYVFLPIGTPDLADLCKELSRKRNLPVNVVNAEPKTHKHMNPNKVSHHIQRIGYHFRDEVLEQACGILGYFPYENRFVKRSDLEKRNQESTVGRILAKHGVIQQHASKEDLDQVRAAIRELFPKMPAQDLKEIVKHAWQENSGRVGRAQDIDLTRRVQLATIARIRHAYTDYDQLLRAFDWPYARAEVEPVCLAKLVEWRGEQDAEDNVMEEIVRETIVIDDDDDDGGVRVTAAEGTDTDDTGNVSDTSVEISHRPAAAEDLRGEEIDERNHRYLPYRPRPRDRDADNRDARAKLESFRARTQQQPYMTYATHPGPAPAIRAQFVPASPTNGRHPHDRIVVEGRVPRPVSHAVNLPMASSCGNLPIPMKQVSPGPASQPLQYLPAHQPAQIGNNAAYMRERLPPPLQHAQGGLTYANNVASHGSLDQPVPSIEPGSPWQRQRAHSSMNGLGAQAQAYHSRPATPDDARIGNRQRAFVDLTQTSSPHWSAGSGAHHADSRLPPRIRNYRGDVVDLMTPPRPRGGMLEARPEVVRVSSGDARYVLAPQDQPRPAGHLDAHVQQRQGYQYVEESRAQYTPVQAKAAYDPMQHGLVEGSHESRTMAAQPTYQPMYEDRQPSDGPPQAYQALQPMEPLPRVIYLQHDNPMTYQAAHPKQPMYRLPPAPVHGGFAPVQQMPREERHRAKEQFAPKPQFAPAPIVSTPGSQGTSDRAYSVGQYYAG